MCTYRKEGALQAIHTNLLTDWCAPIFWTPHSCHMEQLAGLQAKVRDCQQQYQELNVKVQEQQAEIRELKIQVEQTNCFLLRMLLTSYQKRNQFYREVRAVCRRGYVKQTLYMRLLLRISLGHSKSVHQKFGHDPLGFL